MCVYLKEKEIIMQLSLDDIVTNDYKAVWNDDLVGFELQFKSGAIGAVQLSICENVLSASNGEYYLTFYDNGSFDLNENDKEKVFDFIQEYKWSFTDAYKGDLISERAKR